MKQHALKHDLGNSEVGMFNNLWAISSDGKIWVQLTQYEKTWECYDPVSMIPYAAIDQQNCPQSAQYSSAQNQHPYVIYFASAKNQPPPSSGTMRPTVGNNEHEGRIPIVWAERVGLSPKYCWGGALQLAMAEIVMRDGLPVLTNYERNLTPTPIHPDGKNLWSNPGGNTVIGAGYEPWGFSKEDSEILFASDIFFSQSNHAQRKKIFPRRRQQQFWKDPNDESWPGKRKTMPWTEAFTDVIAWIWKGSPSLEDITAYDSQIYNYRENGGPSYLKYLGHWEEPAIFLVSGKEEEFVIFGSSANLLPAWNPLKSKQTFGLDTWIIPQDKTSPARRVTFFNQGLNQRFLTYPTTVDSQEHALFLTVVPGRKPGANPLGSIYKLSDF